MAEAARKHRFVSESGQVLLEANILGWVPLADRRQVRDYGVHPSAPDVCQGHFHIVVGEIRPGGLLGCLWGLGPFVEPDTESRDQARCQPSGQLSRTRCRHWAGSAKQKTTSSPTAPLLHGTHP
jgi:hypothetical protein